VIVVMRTSAQEAKVAEMTGGRVIANDDGTPTTKVALDDFEAHRKAVESVSVLF